MVKFFKIIEKIVWAIAIAVGSIRKYHLLNVSNHPTFKI